MAIERDTLGDFTPEQRNQILKRLDEIEESVTNIKTPLSFADQLYVLPPAGVRSNLGFARHGALAE